MGTTSTVSWDILLMRSDYPSMADFPGDYTPPPLGTGALVRARVQAAAPSLHFKESTWAEVRGAGWSIDASVGAEEPVESILLYLSGEPGALRVVQAMAEALDARALDCSTGRFIDFANPPAGPSSASGRD
jgi:hypothetical protein